jgi:uncharacterized protein YvpB
MVRRESKDVRTYTAQGQHAAHSDMTTVHTRGFYITLCACLIILLLGVTLLLSYLVGPLTTSHELSLSQTSANTLSSGVDILPQDTNASGNLFASTQNPTTKPKQIATPINPAAALPANFTANIEEALQYPELPGGCELVALTCVLRSMGFELLLTEIADDYLELDDSGDFAYGYVGSPYDMGGGFPPSIVAAANAYLRTQDSSYSAQDITGSDFDTLLAWVNAGYPVLVWTTIGMDEPSFSDTFIDEYEWYYNEHCVVLYGIDDEGVLISDPLEGLIHRDAGEFARIYEACGNMAVVIPSYS